MRLLRRSLVSFLVSVLASIPMAGLADDFIISFGEIPNEGHRKFGEQMVKMYEELGLGHAKLMTYPFPRSLQSVGDGKVDAHLPMINFDHPAPGGQNYILSTQPYAKVVFVLYSNKKKPLTRKNLEEAHFHLAEDVLKRKDFVEVAGKLRPLLDFSYSTRLAFEEALRERLTDAEFDRYREKLVESSYPFHIGSLTTNTGRLLDVPSVSLVSVEGAMKMVNAGRLDGYILAQEDCDGIIYKDSLVNVHRSYFDTYPVYLAIPRGEKGKKSDEIISKILGAMKAKKIFDQYSLAIHADKYEDWQP